MPHSELLSRISSKELSEWMAFDSLEPISEPWRADLRHAVLCAHMAAMAGVKDPRARTPATYMPDFDNSQRREQSSDEMMQVVKGLAKIGFGKIIQSGQEVRHSDDSLPDHPVGDADRPVHEGPV